MSQTDLAEAEVEVEVEAEAEAEVEVVSCRVVAQGHPRAPPRARKPDGVHAWEARMWRLARAHIRYHSTDTHRAYFDSPTTSTTPGDATITWLSYLGALAVRSARKLRYERLIVCSAQAGASEPRGDI